MKTTTIKPTSSSQIIAGSTTGIVYPFVMDKWEDIYKKENRNKKIDELLNEEGESKDKE